MKSPFQAKNLVRLCALATLAAGAATAQAAPNQVTRGAVDVTTAMGNLGASWPVVNLINQSGLSAPYVNGVSDFAQFATTTTHLSFTGEWLSNRTSSGFVSFDLGASYRIDGMAWFGTASNSTNRVSSLRVFADTDNNAGNGHGSLLFTSGTFSAIDNLGPNVFSFDTSAHTRFLAVEVLGTTGTSWAVGNEVVFRENLGVSAVPEPGTYVLMLAGLGVVGSITRRRRSPNRR